MLNIIIMEHADHSDREVLHHILLNQHFIISKLSKIMSEAEDLQVLITQLKESQVVTKTSLDAANASLATIKTGVAAIIAGIPAGGLSAAETAALKASLVDTLTTEQANAAEASGTADEASAEAAAVSAAVPPETPAA